MNNKNLIDGEWYLINCANKVYVAGRYSERDKGFWTFANGNPLLHCSGAKENNLLIAKPNEEKASEPVKRRK